MKFIKLLFLTLILSSSNVFAISCVVPDWDEQLCKLEVITGDRCVNAAFFRNYCVAGTVGCESVGGCIGFTPVGHWYPIVDESGTPKKRCRCGCFALDTKFTRENGSSISGFNIREIYDKELESRLSVSSLDAFDSTNFTDRNINSVRFGPEFGDSLYVKTTSNRLIILSKAHPVVIGNMFGKLIAMKAAEELSKGDYLIAKDGSPDKVESIERKPYTGDMINFNIESSDATNHIIEANGILTGDQGWQDQIHSVESRLMWRTDILNFLLKNKGESK